MDALTNRVSGEFAKRFSGEPRLFRAPGRVNLIGEHTDYNEGFVLPFAIDRETIAAAAPRADDQVNVYAVDVDESATFRLSAPPVRLRRNWLDYVEGTLRSLAERSPGSRGIDLAFSSTVPIGGGLSSSAALEVAVGRAFLSVNNLEVSAKDLAFAAQRAEHEYVGIRSGIMDQFTSVFGRAGSAMLLDCRSLEIQHVPLAFSDAMIVVCDSRVKHELASSEYNTRRRECELGVELLRAELSEIKSLRDVTSADLDKYGGDLPENVRRRCRHVVDENARTLKAAEECERGNLKLVGELMAASHVSLRDDYEVSSPELDLLVETAMAMDGVFGSRMTGGGFGGCTVSILRREAFEMFRKRIINRYKTTFGVPPAVFELQATNGASEVTG